MKIPRTPFRSKIYLDILHRNIFSRIISSSMINITTIYGNKIFSMYSICIFMSNLTFRNVLESFEAPSYLKSQVDTIINVQNLISKPKVCSYFGESFPLNAAITHTYSDLIFKKFVSTAYQENLSKILRYIGTHTTIYRNIMMFQVGS